MPKEQEEESYFSWLATTIDYKTDVWFVDNGWSYHMKIERKGLEELDETKKGKFGLVITRKFNLKGRY